MLDYGEKEEKEFVRLLVAHQSLIQSFVVSLIPGSSETEDVLQSTNEVLWAKRKQFELGTNFKGWALTTARLQVMSLQRRLKREKRVYFDDEACEAIFQEALQQDEGETRAA
ncbi:hypothetical protein HW115_15100 [Verrucomicrobiaceae bacterium N1E253]|uniref:RNA polymerase sigma-70 region 2 domain-containing protein n=1 Tax=Oceaniferula marina TaxID=2748318 RepID=A0A851GGN3_9BACT|nr:sigma factor [Oceaniferula marina]NWK56948.1 hypothetical protein [Oceaniferula marina]